MLGLSGIKVGFSVGPALGSKVGLSIGGWLGSSEGDEDGSSVGFTVGLTVLGNGLKGTNTVGTGVGVGFCVGRIVVGRRVVGVAEGLFVGAVGVAVGANTHASVVVDRDSPHIDEPHCPQPKYETVGPYG